YPGGLFVPDAGASVVGNTAINAIRKPAYGSVRGLIVILQDRLFIPAMIAFALLEGACVRWYRKNGLLP
ncbi:hypothetical protein, partial [Pseudoxanthomonas wuyuanensis]|uniref:hypothetical protein n=1 Tax=Pseudoxanthomonas wuyuanensis TaxID=1073196 RepID=UPI001EE482AD